MQTHISNIQRFSVHDGPGIRTTVFFMGCPLKCKWCHNPEAIRRTIQLMFNPEVCIGCGSCVAACPRGALTLEPGEKARLNRAKCNHQLACTEVCPSEALLPSGRIWALDALVKEVLKDEVVFRNGGGVTLSGGEPLLDGEFSAAFLEKLKSLEIHTAVETSGYPDWENYQRVLNLVDLFLMDVKLISPEAHRRWTGVNNERILKNIQRVSAAGKTLVLRIPLIPGVNDTDEAFGAIVAFASELPQVSSIHILPFHQIGQNKYIQLDIPYELNNLSEDNDSRISVCTKMARSAGFKVSIGGAGVREDRS